MAFTVFAKARPIRIAFVLPQTEAFDAMCDGLAAWSSKSWAGRQSAVALLENDSTLSADAWKELIRFDPDHIYSFTPLSDELLAKLDDELLPWSIKESNSAKEALESREETKEHAGGTSPNPNLWIEEHIEVPAVPVPPTEKNLAALGQRPLLLFHFGKECPVHLRRFVHRNLGAYDQWFDLRTGEPRSLGWLEDLLAKAPIKRIRVDDLPSLCNAMELISGTPYGNDHKAAQACATACELSSAQLPRSFQRGTLGYTYRVVVGSSLKDFTLYWRSCSNEGDGVWEAQFRHCLWIPKELIHEAAFTAALKNWLYHFTGQGSSGSHTVEATSASLSQTDMSALFEACGSGPHRVPTRFVAVADIEARWRKERAEKGERRLIAGSSVGDAERLVAVNRAQTWELRPPEVIHSPVQTGTWAVDVQAERESREGGIPGQDWWHLPRKSGRGLVATMFRAPSRICRNGLFAVEMQRASVWPDSQTAPRLHLELPDDSDVVRGLLLIQREPWFDYGDPRRERVRTGPILTDLEISDAGRKLRGLIDLFGGFWRARHYWERSFWREMFCLMARRSTRYESSILSETKQVIQKELRKHGVALQQKADDEVAQKISHRVLNQVATRFRDVPLTFADMKGLRADLEKAFKAQQQAEGTKQIHYLAGDTLVHMLSVEPVSEEDLESGLHEMVQLGVFRMGMSVRCPRCRLQHWLEAENLRQCGSCPGCGSPMPLIPESVWSYRLNPLIHHCVNHNVLAVWHALQQVSHRLGSFFFTPSSELRFAKPVNGKPKSEVDVLCVTDGELLLGEVKTGPLAESDFKEFAAIVLALRPDLGAVFVESEHYDERASKWFEGFQERLKPLGISGQLYCLTNY